MTDRYQVDTKNGQSTVIDTRCRMVTTSMTGKGAAQQAREHAKMLNDASK
jgi:hypothetical protein